MIVSTLCYIEKDNKYLFLHRIKKQNDVNEGKWIGVGGKLEPGESPEDCVCRETEEETGFILDSCQMRGILTFSSEGWEDEYIFVFTSNEFHGEEKVCDEGDLCWIDRGSIMNLNLWEGDRLFLQKILDDDPFFSIKLSYKGDNLVESTVHTY